MKVIICCPGIPSFSVRLLQVLSTQLTVDVTVDLEAASAGDLVVSTLREEGTLAGLRAGDCSVIALAPGADVAARIELLDRGADHVLHDGLSVEEVAAQVRAVVRRQSRLLQPAWAGGADVVLDPASRQVVVSGRRIALTAIEYRLLEVLMAEPRRVFSSDELLVRVWGSPIGATSTVSASIRRLRLKLEPVPAHPALITTTWGAGYTFHARD